MSATDRGARLRTDRHLDSGFTVVELLVAMALMAVIGTVSITAIVGTMRSSRQEQNRLNQENALSVVADRMTKDIRVADPVQSASGTSLSVQVYRATSVGGTATCQRRTWTYSSTAGTLTETTQVYATSATCSTTSPSPTSTATVTLLSSMPKGLSQVFTYAPNGAYCTTTPAACTNGALTSPVSDTTAIRSVTFSLTGTVPENRKSVSLTSTVELRNATS